MATKTDEEIKKSIIEKCDSTHLVVCFLLAERFYAPPGGHDYTFVLFAKCPITGLVYQAVDSNYIDGKVLHYIDSPSMEYKLKNCNVSDWYAEYESWDSVISAIAKHNGIRNKECLKDLFRENFEDATFKSDISMNVKTMKKVRLFDQY